MAIGSTSSCTPRRTDWVVGPLPRPRLTPAPVWGVSLDHSAAALGRQPRRAAPAPGATPARPSTSTAAPHVVIVEGTCTGRRAERTRISLLPTAYNAKDTWAYTLDE